MSIINEPERSKLYKKVRHVLGAPLRSVELEDEQMDTLLEFSIDEYEEKVQDWLTESQWTSLYNLNLDTQSLSRAFTTRSLAYEDRYTYAYSKIVGLQAGGDWELKKDYINLVPNQQIYEIPANREINELLWFTPPELNNMLFDPWSFGSLGVGGGLGGGGGLAQMGNNMATSYFMMPAFDMLLRMQEINIQRRIIAGELTYRITALPGGKKAIHLMNTPGGKFDFGNATLMRGGKVWYWYYDAGPDDRDDCLKQNPDIIRLPSDVPFVKLNCYRIDPSQLESNPNMTGEYNIPRAIVTFNKRVEPLLVVFKEEIRNSILVKNPEERPFFTKQQCELINGLPFKPGDQDDVDKDLLTMEKGEVEFWENVGINPDYIYDLADNGWEAYV